MKSFNLLTLCLALLAGAKGEDEEGDGITCPDINIIGGMLTKSNGNEVDSIMKFQCPDSSYPSPVSHTKCLKSGRWFRLSSRHTTAICKEFTCPTPVLESGMFSPVNSSYGIGETVTFECYDGYELQGSVSRTCMKNGRWNGTTTICNSGLQHCPHPGIPAGGRKFGTGYGIGDKVQYSCHEGLVLVGSRKRECLEAGEWTGTEAHCQHKSSFDSPQDVAAAFTASFTNTLGLTQTGGTVKSASVARKIILSKDAPLHIYILLDASESVGEANFQEAKAVAINLIDKIASFDVRPRFGIITYASSPLVVVHPYDEEFQDADEVINLLSTSPPAEYAAHGDQRGTNIHGALEKVREMMVFSKTQFKNSWDKIRFVTILFTDGKANMGGNPKAAADQIKNFVMAQNKTEDYLDMYSFGVSEDVDKTELNALSSEKNGEKHCFIVRNIQDLVQAFNDILDMTTIGDLCGVADENPEVSGRKKYPWHAVMRFPGTGTCSGSIVSNSWVLTAAHCLKGVETQKDINRIVVEVGESRKMIYVKDVHLHPRYDLLRLKDEGISQFYDYDVALLELKEKIDFSKSNSRSICLPCTTETTRAMRKAHPRTTCNDHETELLPTTRTVPAIFVKRSSSGSEQETPVTIKTTEAVRKACEANALRAEEYKDIPDVRKVVTERFLCTGGHEPTVEEVSCKGDSGAALYIAKKRRFIQVGVVSWGVINVCGIAVQDKKYARDFHINLFKVLPWLKQKLGKIVTFIE
ncbi:complement factor B-like [Heterodontus francisci]|uniref:complement factor B-like n=1 Tax=Heterodontus francisci TaxID=7792 RepID=UPI00355BC2E3